MNQTLQPVVAHAWRNDARSSLELPNKEMPPGAYSAAVTPFKLPADTQILVVDDEPYFCACLQAVLEEAGYVVYTACNGEAALRIVQTLPIDLVMTDLNMPVMDGYTLCIQLRTFSKVLIIIVSSSTVAMDRQLGLDAGADEYLIKPIQWHQVEGQIQRLLGRTA